MINKEDFVNRLRKMMEYYGVSAAELADSIQVQRSGISHLLSGRNKPSLDFILKLLEAYPEVRFDWLVKGEGDFLVSTEFEKPTPTLFDTQTFGKTPEKKTGKKNLPDIEARKARPDRSLQKIILLYNDGSFEVYDE